MVEGLPEDVLTIPVPSMGRWPRGKWKTKNARRRCSDYPDDLTKAVVFPALRCGRLHHGAVLMVDGGQSLR